MHFYMAYFGYAPVQSFLVSYARQRHGGQVTLRATLKHSQSDTMSYTPPSQRQKSGMVRRVDKQPYHSVGVAGVCKNRPHKVHGWKQGLSVWTLSVFAVGGDFDQKSPLWAAAPAT